MKHKLYKRTLCFLFFGSGFDNFEHLLNQRQAARKTFVPLALKLLQCASSKASRDKRPDVLARCSGEVERVEGAGPVSGTNPADVCVWVWVCVPPGLGAPAPSSQQCFKKVLSSAERFTTTDESSTVFFMHIHKCTHSITACGHREEESELLQAPRREAHRWTRRGLGSKQESATGYNQSHSPVSWIFFFFVYFIQTREEVHDCGKKPN